MTTVGQRPKTSSVAPTVFQLNSPVLHGRPIWNIGVRHASDKCTQIVLWFLRLYGVTSYFRSAVSDILLR